MTLYGWVGKILTVDLTSGKLSEEDTSKLAERYVGGRGIASWIGWREIPPGVDAFSPENRLIFMTGPLTGTLAPASGRLEICGKAPQAYPRTHYTRSSIGGHWGPELKYAGFDGIIIHGKARSPVYLWIEDGETEIEDARRLWGLDTFATQKNLREKHGKGTQICCIGPAGENMVRIAVIQSGIENAAGQGGFGAVMGSKNLKAIAVRGSGGVKIARPDQFMKVCAHVRSLRPFRVSHITKREALPEPNNKACSMACGTHCSMRVYRKKNGEVVAAHCCSPGVSLKRKSREEEPHEEGLEVELLCDKYGLNRWEINWMGFGKGSWFYRAKEAGELTEKDFGMPLDLDSPQFWCELLRKITYKEGIGRVLAEGMPRAADILQKSWEHLPHVGHGYAAHWDGHLFFGNPRYPHWIVSALTWAMDSRDPIVHCYAQEIARWYGYGGGRLSIDEIEKVSERIYGSRSAVALDSGYEYKVQPTIWHQDRDVIKDSLPVCDQMGFPLLYSEKGYGDTAAEANLFSAATGIDVTERELNRFGERVINLERAIMIMEGRTRKDDESIVPYFRKPDGEGIILDTAKFSKLIEEFYELRGWSKTRGCPSRKKLEELDLREVADELDKLEMLG